MSNTWYLPQKTPVMQWCEIQLMTFSSFALVQKEMWVKEVDDTLTMLREVKWPLEHLLVSFFHSFSSLIFITSLQLCPHRRPTAQTAPNPLTNPHFNITSFTKAKSRQKSTSPSSAAFNMQDAAIEATERRYYELYHLWERFCNYSVLFPCYFFASFIMLIISSPQDNRFAHTITPEQTERC